MPYSVTLNDRVTKTHRLMNVDDVVMATAKHDPENLQPSCDFKYRTLVAFLPGAGVFYCAPSGNANPYI